MRVWAILLTASWASLSATSREVQEVIDASMQLIQESRSEEPIVPNPQKCLREHPSEIPHESGVMLFLSFSVPPASWIALSQELESIGGRIILRGLPGGSFPQMAQEIQGMRKRGVRVDIDIHPELFDTYHITAVPSFVLRGDRYWDKSAGNIPIADSLRLFSEKGETASLAQTLLGRLQEQSR